MNDLLHILSGLLVVACIIVMYYCFKYTDDDSIAGTNYMLVALVLAVLSLAVKP